MSIVTERRKITPPELAARWGIAPEKVIVWIKSGELRAIDASLFRGGAKPRYLIDETDIEAFETARQVAPPLPTSRRRRNTTDIVRNFR